MGIFNNKVPKKKEIEKHFKNMISSSQELKNIIVSQNCIDYSKVDINSLDYVTFLYDLNIYNSLLQVKYSRFYIETTIRTIFITLEDNLKSAGNNVESNYFNNIYNSLSKSLIDIFNLTKEFGEDGFKLIAIYLCLNELYMSDEQIDINEELINKITDHFNKIINFSVKNF